MPSARGAAEPPTDNATLGIAVYRLGASTISLMTEYVTHLFFGRKHQTPEVVERDPASRRVVVSISDTVLIMRLIALLTLDR